MHGTDMSMFLHFCMSWYLFSCCCSHAVQWTSTCPVPNYEPTSLVSRHPVVRQLINGHSANPASSHVNAQVDGVQQPVAQGRAGSGVSLDRLPASSLPRIALVFGREELGLADVEVEACDAVCSIPIGRLQVSRYLVLFCGFLLCWLTKCRVEE
jgi:hypothetical protein